MGQRAKQIQLTDFQMGTDGICRFLYFNNGIKIKEYLLDISKMSYSNSNSNIVLELNDIEVDDKEYVAYSEITHGFMGICPKIYFTSKEKILIERK